MIMTEFDEIFEDESQLAENLEIPVEGIGSLGIEEELFPELTEEFAQENNILDDLLKAKGITNSMITIVDENEEEKEVNFYELTKEEQLEILNYNEPAQNDILEDTEVEFLNHLRTNGVSVEEFLATYRESILAEMNTAEPNYEIDNYDDNELFLLDLKIKFDLTDEELQSELEKELKNPELFGKKTTKLRLEYKQLEDNEKATQQAKFEDDQRQEYNNFVSSMAGISNSVTDYHGVYLEDNEKAETLDYLTKLDESGVSRFSKDLNDPNKLYEAAWYLRYGKEAFQALEAAYEAEIKKLKVGKKDEPRGFVQKSQKIKNINDLI